MSAARCRSRRAGATAPETMDLDPTTIKAVWGFNGTERPGAGLSDGRHGGACLEGSAGFLHLWS